MYFAVLPICQAPTLAALHIGHTKNHSFVARFVTTSTRHIVNDEIKEEKVMDLCESNKLSVIIYSIRSL